MLDGVVIIGTNQGSKPLAEEVKGIEVGIVVLVLRGRRRGVVEALAVVEAVLLLETALKGHGVDAAHTAHGNVDVAVVVVALLVLRLLV